MLRRGLRLFWRVFRLHPRPFTVSVVGAAAFAFAAVATTVVLGRITDEVIIPAFDDDGVAASRVLAAVVAIMAVALVRAAGAAGRRFFAAMTEFRTQRTFRRGLSDRYLDLPLAYHQATSTGKLLAHADADVETATLVLRGLPFAIGVVFLIVFAVISLAVVDPLFMVVGLLLFPALGVLNRVYTARVEEPAGRAQHEVGVVSSIAHESFDGALVVKALGREDAEGERMAEASERLRVARVDIGRLRAIFEPAIDAFPNIGIVALLAIGAWRVSTEAITAGDVVQAMALFGMLAFPVRVLGFVLEELPRSVVSVERVDGVLDEVVPRRAPETSLALPEGPLGVAFEDVGFGYGDLPVLSDFSAAIAPGEVVALVGATGAGKSTVCELLAGLDRPSQGAIMVGGVDIDRIDPDVLSREVALVFQETFLFATSVRENILLAADVEHSALRRVADLARADRFIMQLPRGYDTVVGERGVTLSGGQRQRVALARALVRQPRVLLLDDATSAVDPVVEAEILAGLREAAEATVLIVAHRVSTITLADRVAYLADGRLAGLGSHEELLTIPAYEAMVRAYEQVQDE